MYDAACPSEPALQRARGNLLLGFRQRDGVTVLERLRQEGCLKARFPRPEPGGWAGAVTLNSSGGIAGGDALSTRIAAGEGARVAVAGQAAERFYRALPGSAPARVRTAIEVAPGAAVEWLPQEAILFDRSALDRRLEVGIAQDAWFLGVESLVFGRTAMGEEVVAAFLRDAILLRRDGRIVLHDAIRMNGAAVCDALDRAALGGGARAIATVLHASPEAEARLDAVRAALEDAPARAGVSAWDGMLVARVAAPDGASLRAAVLAALAALRADRPLPRVWLC
jgi:urease accessory protein